MRPFRSNNLTELLKDNVKQRNPFYLSAYWDVKEHSSFSKAYKNSMSRLHWNKQKRLAKILECNAMKVRQRYIGHICCARKIENKAKERKNQYNVHFIGQ